MKNFFSKPYSSFMRPAGGEANVHFWITSCSKCCESSCSPFRNTCSEWQRGPTCPSSACWSTLAEKWTVRPGWSPQSTLSTYFQEEWWSWPSLCCEPGQWSISASYWQCQSTWWSHQTHHVDIQFLLNVNITLHDGVEGGLMDMVSQDSVARKEKWKSSSGQ